MAQPKLNQKSLNSIPVPFPPKAEQQLIVAILDEAFVGIEAAIANTQKNLANARELFESYLNAVFTQKGDGWVEKTLEEMVESVSIGLVKSKREQGKNLAYKYIKMNNITNDNRFDDSEAINVDATDNEVEKYQLIDGDFLFNTRNSHELVGKSCLYKASSSKPVLFNNNIMRIRFCSVLTAPFAAYAFTSQRLAEQLESIKNGTTNVSAIYHISLKEITLQFPQREKQLEITSKLDALQAQVERLEAIYQKKLAALTELKQSILQKAFAGELTTQPAGQEILA